MNTLLPTATRAGPPRVMHVDFVALSDNASRSGLEALFAEARRLSTLDEVLTAGVIEGASGSDFELAFLFVLRDFTALEPFGTNPRYSQFLQVFVAPVLRQLAGADVSLDGDMPAIDGAAACLALAATDETYDWEVSEALATWADEAAPSARVTGLAVGERQRYRGVALAFGRAAGQAVGSPGEHFTSTLVEGTARRLT